MIDTGAMDAPKSFRSRTITLGLAALALATLAGGSLGGCSGSSEPWVEPASWQSLIEPGPYEVGEWSTLLYDGSRPTAANGEYPGDPGRTLATHIYYPTEPGARPVGTESAAKAPLSPSPDGPFPVLGYAHGFTSSNQAARGLISHLVSHGYVVIAPNFPLSHGGAPGGPTVTDMHNQPGDLAFAIETIGAAEEIPLRHLAGAMDMNAVGIVGLSLGGATVMIGTYHPTFHIPFAKAAVAHAPATCFFGEAFYDRLIPTLIISGDADELVPFRTAPQRSFELAERDVTLMRQVGGTHVGILGIGAADGPNPDVAIGCAAVSDDVPTEDDGTFDLVSEALQGDLPGTITDPDACTEGFCDNGFEHSMSGARQFELTMIATLAHFEAELRGDAAARAFLTRSIGAEEDVEISVK